VTFRETAIFIIVSFELFCEQVTFRETAILVDPANTSADSKQRIALIVSHEMAHQWFGELSFVKVKLG
jgi:hypothetical protein